MRVWVGVGLQFQIQKMDRLRCSACCARYTEPPQPHVPLVLSCGHTFCQRCIEGSLKDNTIPCLSCGKETPTPNSQALPVNKTLIEMLQESRSAEDETCRAHKKKYDVYCEKCKEPICVQCNLTTHNRHKATMISTKVQADRTALKDALQKNQESYQDSKRAVERLKDYESQVESNFLDNLMEISVFYKHIIEAITALQEKEVERVRREKEDILRKIEEYRAEALQKQAFHEKLHEIYTELENAREIEFLKRENQQAFILNNCRAKKDKHVLPAVEFKRVNCLQEIINCLQEMNNFQKKKVIHSNSVFVPNKDKEAMLHGSPSLKKTSKEPAVLEVNLSEEYNKRKGNQQKDQKDMKNIKPAKKVINISTDKDKEKVGQAVGVGSSFPKSGKTSELKYIRESSIKKSREPESMFFDELDLSQNFTPVSANSFMRSSRESQANTSHLHESSIKNSFNSFSLFQSEEKVYIFGGRVQSRVEKYFKQSGKCQKVGLSVNRKQLQVVYHRPYSYEKCLIIGGTSVSGNQSDMQIYEFSFKLERVSKTSFHLGHPRSSFGCVSKGESVYIAGGKHEKALNTFERLDFVGNGMEITKLGNMIQAREGLGCCLGFDGFIYAAGGVNNSKNILNSCQRYNWQKKSWESVQHMKHQRRGFSLVAVPHGIFAIGGHSSLSALASVQLFDFNRGEWVEMAPMNEARCYHSAVLSHDYQTITVFGGFADNKQLDSIEVYEIDANRWTSAGRLKEKRCLHTCLLSPQ